MKKYKTNLSSEIKIKLFKQFVDLEYFQGLDTLLKDPFKITLEELNEVESYFKNNKNSDFVYFINKKLVKTRNLVLKNLPKTTNNIEYYVNNLHEGALGKALIQATKKKDFSLFYQIVKRDPNLVVNGSFSLKKLTPIHLICSFGSEQQIQSIINLGGNLHKNSSHGLSALDFCLSFNNPEALKVLIKNSFSFKSHQSKKEQENYYQILNTFNVQNTSPLLDDHFSNITEFYVTRFLSLNTSYNFKRIVPYGIDQMNSFLKMLELLEQIEPKGLKFKKNNALHILFKDIPFNYKKIELLLPIFDFIEKTNQLDLFAQKDPKRVPLDYLKNPTLANFVNNYIEKIKLQSLNLTKNKTQKKIL